MQWMETEAAVIHLSDLGTDSYAMVFLSAGSSEQDYALRVVVEVVDSLGARGTATVDVCARLLSTLVSSYFWVTSLESSSVV
jgi:hypothetical protein